MVDVPVASPVATPAVVIVATEVVADAQVTWLVRSWVELSEKVPVAVKCSVSPLGTLGLAGVTAIDSRRGRGDGEDRRAGDAIERGGDRRGARRHAGGQSGRGDGGDGGRGRGPGHLAGQVFCRVVGEGAGGGEAFGFPLGILGLAGVTAIERRTAGVTVSTVEPVMPLSVALIVDVPVSTAVATPFEPANWRWWRRRSWPTPRSPGW